MSSRLNITDAAEANQQEEECLICREYSTFLSQILPCGHKYHEECIRSWIEFVQSFTKCPYCTQTVSRVNHYKPSVSKPPIVGEEEFEVEGEDEDEVDELVDDPGISDLDTYFASETRRLEGLFNTNSSHAVRYLDVCVSDGIWLISIQRTLILEITQFGTCTRIQMKHRLLLTSCDATDDWEVERFADRFPPVNTDVTSMQEYEKAKNDIVDIQRRGGIRVANTDIPLLDDGRFRSPIQRLSGGERGITTKVQHGGYMYQAWSQPDQEYEVGPYAHIEWNVLLEEKGVALPNGHPEFVVRATHDAEKVAYTNQTYENIKGVMDWVFQVCGVRFQGRPLDRGCTNLLEPHLSGVPLSCWLCREEHHTGDCLPLGIRADQWT